MNSVKIAIVGSRSYPDFKLFSVIMTGLVSQYTNLVIISGGAPGVDAWAKNFASVHGIEYKEFLADRETYGKSAGPIRNSQIVGYSDIVVAFWDGKSKGTHDTILKALLVNKMVFVYPPGNHHG